MGKKYDFIIIGSGVIGAALARELSSRRAGSILVLEKEPSPGQHASGRNSGVIHSGINQKPGSLKAKMCLAGSQRLRAYCVSRKIPMNVCGTLVVARNKEEIQTLEKLKEMGKACGVEGLRLLSREELSKREPEASALTALLSPNGATVDSKALLSALIEEARQSGVQFHFNEEVLKIDKPFIRTKSFPYEAKHLINCAGLYSDKIAHKMGLAKNLRIIPFRGEYMEVKNCLVNSMIYQPPDLRFPFLSIHLTRETDGKVLAGPSAVLALGREAYEKQIVSHEALEMFFSPHFLRLATNKTFLQMAFANAKTCLLKKVFLKQIQSLVPSVRLEDIQPYRAGIRAQMVDSNGKLLDDLLVHYEKDSTHVLNAVSPGMTSALPFAEYVVDRILSTKLLH